MRCDLKLLLAIFTINDIHHFRLKAKPLKELPKREYSNEIQFG